MPASSRGSGELKAMLFSMRLWVVFLALSPGTLPALAAKPREHCVALEPGKPELWGYDLVAEYPHDPEAFTQGLVFERWCDDERKQCEEGFWESTGNYGQSDVRRVALGSGAVSARTRLRDQHFGEGLARLGARLYQVTWETPEGLIYSTEDLKQVGTFKTPLRDGWGVAADGELLVVSDGTPTLTWLDPADGFRRARSVEVRAEGRAVRFLNELEMVGGEIWANVWQTECIARICPQTGAVTGWLMLHGLGYALHRRGLGVSGKPMDVLNGIAWDPEGRRLFVTGKWWPRLFEVAPRAINPHKKENRQRAQACIV